MHFLCELERLDAVKSLFLWFNVIYFAAVLTGIYMQRRTPFEGEVFKTTFYSKRSAIQKRNLDFITLKSFLETKTFVKVVILSIVADDE